MKNNICNQEIYAEGFKKGWKECREFICKKYNLNIEEVITAELIDEGK